MLHVRNISSTYLHQIQGLSYISDGKRFSKSAMNKMEYGGTNLIPIAVSRFCLNVSSKN